MATHGDQRIVVSTVGINQSIETLSVCVRVPGVRIKLRIPRELRLLIIGAVELLAARAARA